MRITITRRSVTLGAVLTIILSLALAFIFTKEAGEPQTSQTNTARTERPSEAADPSAEATLSTSAIDTVPYSPPSEADPIDPNAIHNPEARPSLTLDQLDESTKKRIRHRIAVSNLMAGLENELQLESLAMTPEKWEEIRLAIHEADRGSSPLIGQARSALDPLLTKLIEEGRAEADDPMTAHRVRGQHGYAVRHIVTKSRGPGTLSQSTFALRYQWGSSREVDTALEPIERELSRRSAELGNKLRSIIAREQ